MNAQPPNNSDHREASDRYRAEVYRLHNWRVIVCKDRLQWILQHRKWANGPAGGRWEGQHYFRTREAALRLWRGKTGDDGSLLALLLPERLLRS